MLLFHNLHYDSMKKAKTFFAGAVAIAMMAVSLPACSDDDDNNGINNVPEAFVNALKKVEPDAKDVKWETEGAYRVAEFKKNMVDYDVWFDAIIYYKQTTDEFYVIEVETAGQPDMDLFYTTGGEMIKAIPSASVPDILPTTVISR